MRSAPSSFFSATRVQSEPQVGFTCGPSYCCTATVYSPKLQRLRRNAQPRRRRAVEDDELALHEDVTVGGDADAGIGLEASEACYDITG
jgi:hypothetical protein